MARGKSARVVKLPRGRQGVRRSERELLDYGRTVIAAEAAALSRLALDESFATAVEWILGCRGRVVVTGLAGEVRIARDTDGVPLIAAGGDEDAAFGLGFAHAQDRLFQMDVNRRTPSGTDRKSVV